LGLLVIGVIASLVGLIGCCIGIVFTIPFIYSLYYALYSEIIGFDPENEIENRN
jgi:ABC-type antimicrobial peptide transport system permease subunit